MVNVFSKKMYWFIPLVLIGIIAVGLIITFVYLPAKENAGILGNVTPPANLTNSPTPPAQKESAAEKGWNKTFGGGIDTRANSVRQTSDGGYIVTGYVDYGLIIPKERNGTQIIPQNNIYLLKTDAHGNIVWNKSFGGRLSISDCSGYDNAVCTLNWNKSSGGLSQAMGNSVRQTSDGGYIIVGKYQSGKLHNRTSPTDYALVDYVTGAEVYLIKTDANGNMQWDKTFGGEYYDEIGYDVQQTSDGGYFIVGTTNSYRVCKKCANPLLRAPMDIYLIKTDANGNKVWNKTIGEMYIDTGYPVQQTFDGGYIAVGVAASFIDNGVADVYLLKIDANGNKSWGKTFGRNKSSEAGFSVQQASDGGYIIGLVEEVNLTGREKHLIKTDANGNMQWDKTFRWEEDKNPFVYSDQQTSDGGYITVGLTLSSSTYLTKTDAYGNKVWERIFRDKDYIGTRSVQQTSDGGYIISTGTLTDKAFSETGYPKVNIYLIKTDANGNV
jgi:hypothetical protein